MTNTNSSHQEFDKYDVQGAYHWTQMRPRLRRFNAGLAARYQLALSLISKHCDCSDMQSILDIGCGDGYFTTKLAQLFPSATVDGYDFSATGIKLARAMSNARNANFHIGNAFDSGKTNVSLITATDVIEHLYDYREFLQLCYDNLRLGGFLVLSTPVRIKETPDDPFHIHEFFQKELALEVSSVGFKVLDHLASHDYQILDDYGKRYSLLGIGRMRFGKYLSNFKSLVLNRNPFAVSNPNLPTMQYLLAVKV